MVRVEIPNGFVHSLVLLKIKCRDLSEVLSRICELAASAHIYAMSSALYNLRLSI